MKDIRIFVASSKELLPERNYLAYLAHEGEFERRGFRVRLSKWEYVDPTMTEARTEDRYLDEMLDCDAVLMMFRHVLGMYTKEEVDKAIAAEAAGTSRIKKHLMLFKDGDVEPSAELADWRSTLAEGTYGTFTDFDELRRHFLRLVEELSGLPLQDIVQDESTRTVSAFLAVDDELAADRNAFADAVQNLNDVLVRRGARVRLRFYDPGKHRELLESSEMALVLYHTKCGDFGEKALDESYGRSKRDENPKRLYVFFRDANRQLLDGGFEVFKNGFADKFGSAPCRFENVDTLSLNFLFSLESVLGDDSGTFVKLNGRTVVVDGLEVGDLAKLPMLEKNGGLAALFSRMQDVSKKFVEQRGKCEKDPQDDGLYAELLDISAEKNRLQDQIDRELKMNFNLARRMAAVSIVQTNETIARARAKMDEGKIKEALEILDGASAAMKRRRLLHHAAERAEAEELQIKELKAGIEIEYFRIDAVMAYTAMPFDERFKKVEGIYKSLVEDVGTFAEMCTMRNKDEMDLLHADVLRKFARSYGIVSDSLSPVPLLENATTLYKSVEDRGGRSFPLKRMAVLPAIAYAHESNNQLSLAEDEYSNLLQVARKYSEQNGGKGKWRLANTLKSLSRLHFKCSHFEKARYEALESLHIFQSLEDGNPGAYGDGIAEIWNILSGVYKRLDAVEDAGKCFASAIQTIRDRLPTHPTERYLLAGYLFNYGQFLNAQKEETRAEVILNESLSLWREEIAENPIKYAENLSGTLKELSIIYSSNRKEESKRALEECVQIDRRNAARNPSRFLPDLQVSLFNLGVLLEDDDRDAATRYYEEALTICRRIANENPARYERKLILSLSGYGDFIENIGGVAKAKTLYLEALGRARGIVDRGEQGAAQLVATALNDIAWLYKRQKNFEESEKHFEELLVIRREQAVKNPRRYNADVARILAVLADIKKEQGKLNETERLYVEAIGIRRSLVKSNPTKYEGILARTLHNMGMLQVRMSNSDAARESFAEALKIRTRLVEHDPEKYQKEFDNTKAELAKLEISD